VTSYPDAELLPGLVILRFDAPLFFANTRAFREQVLALAATEPRPVWILVAAEPVTDIDTTAADMLHDLDKTLNAQGISLVFAELKDPVRARVDRYELTDTIDPDHFYPTLTAAVDAFREKTGARWAPADAVPGAE
jgi:MFS superfamily sulfate permease-like transporter